MGRSGGSLWRHYLICVARELQLMRPKRRRRERTNVRQQEMLPTPAQRPSPRPTSPGESESEAESNLDLFSSIAGVFPLTSTSQKRDADEGADFLMVKPALPYLDIMSDAARIVPDHPVACYQVSGEFAMIHAGAEKGIYDLKEMAFETVESMVRAGACIILTYFTPQFLDWLDEERTNV
jgi:hypothetical protein